MLREFNNIQHQVVGYISYALGPDEDVRFLPMVVKCLLEPHDEYVRDSATYAWSSSRILFAPVA